MLIHFFHSRVKEKFHVIEKICPVSPAERVLKRLKFGYIDFLFIDLLKCLIKRLQSVLVTLQKQKRSLHALLPDLQPNIDDAPVLVKVPERVVLPYDAHRSEETFGLSGRNTSLLF